ncbi:LOW QUALITY PROTEIN: SUN domain-containing ossification factor [Drosophila eugracilis]|uniref:LOW QUALITY PROTEIN: SUN domain-containing ossification factor n=1 Tax=Drosophila eugracilis TaxID=29029 RepID=UPI001BDA0F73|nr:LOW QUALITY PROTEIN: SUN domain-containing ossification factor [Drosophila eugracilis]
MHMRLHLVRFMYINLLLSCCFWLYDNVAAADAQTQSNDGGSAEGLTDADRKTHINPEEPEAPPKPEPPPPPLHEGYGVLLPTPDGGEVPVLNLITTSSSEEESQTGNLQKVGDTSVPVKERPSLSAHYRANSHSEYVSEFDLAADGDASSSTAQVPNNQLNYNNRNSAGKVHSFSESQQLEQPKQLEEEKQSPQLQQPQAEESFPEIITELPTVTITELPLDRLKNRLESIILDDSQVTAGNQSEEEQHQEQAPRQDQPKKLYEADKEEVPQKDEQMPKINDPGGGIELDGLAATQQATPVGEGNETSEELPTAAGSSGSSASNDTEATANLTNANEEVPMPVFSEWAQKQMEAEASREQAMELEQQVVNNSAQRRNNTGSSSGKPPTLMVRSKNYASPDCGAKIIAHNSGSKNTEAVLTQSTDEYMLSICESRIWFVVELCEAIQAQKVDVANYELFSSSPKNFTVSVSKRFPTRDWSNVGRFAAEDKRTIQTFDLHPHLFGKFVRVEITSHYSNEHFCPLSLFRVSGTSEYEAFETEIRPSDDLDDFYDDYGAQEQKAAVGSGGNIFQSASDAVMQIVKKAAEVLVKPTKALKWSAESLLCQTPAFEAYSCSNCNSTLVERINSLLSCQFQQLQGLLSLSRLRSDLLQSRVCQEDFGIRLTGSNFSSKMGKEQSYFLSMLPTEHIGAMCKLIQAEQNVTDQQQTKTPAMKRQVSSPEQLQDNATATGVRQDCENIEGSRKKETLVKEPPTPSLEVVVPESSQEVPSMEDQSSTSSESVSTTNSTPADVNIFNVPADSEEVVVPKVQLPQEPTLPTTLEPSDIETSTNAPATNVPPTSSETSANGDLTIEDGNPANWESIDNLLTTTVASITAGGGAAAAAAAVVNGNGNLGVAGVAGAGGTATGSGVNLQQKLTNGAQSESVFIMLSNRIKALERNMSLSGQYLEELSRRYKKQVEELQQTLTQQTLTVRQLEDQSRRYVEQEQLYQQQSAELAGEVRALSYQVQACILVIIIVGTCIFLMLVLGTVYYRKLRRQQQQLLKKNQPGNPPVATKPKLDRRKSYEQMPNQTTPKQRRPSEEAMLILKECGDNVLHEQDSTNRQRKISVCYGSNNNIAANMINATTNGGRSSLHRRKGAKHSWHSSMDTTETSCGEQTDKFFDVDTLKSIKQSSGKASKKKSQQQQHILALKRQESAPASFPQDQLTEELATQSDFDESLMLDNDDLPNFIPTSDLAYNEFMPEGPSGYQILDTVDGKTSKEQGTKKSRRLSSPAFFKSPFSKSKNKGYSFNGIKNSHSVHEPTSWEWYRLKRNEKHQQQQQAKLASKSMPSTSLDSSSLSEVNFPLSSNTATQNSFRILGEAILSSGEGRITPNGNGNATSGGMASSSSGSGSGGSTTSSTTKKKQRALNNLFRKAFDF